MRITRLVLSFLFILGSSPRLNSQQSTAAPQRDPQAVAILTQTKATANWQTALLPNDIVATGTAIRYMPGQPDDSGTIVIKWLKPDSYSIQTTYAGTTSMMFIKSGSAGRRSSTGTIAIPVDGAKSWHFPFLTDIPNLTDANILYEYAGVETVDGQQAHRVKLWRDGSESPPRAEEIRRGSPMTIWVSTTTYLPLRVEYKNGTLTGRLLFNTCTRKLADYRSVNGIYVPFTQEEWQGSQKLYSIRFQDVRFNNGLTGADFQ